jgi:hypothetical protein
MTIGNRSLVVGSLIVVASVLYGAAKYYSPSLVFLVVEQSLIQKAPPQLDRALLHERLRAQIAEAPDKDSQMQTLFRISEYVEKVQYLTLEQLDQLLPVQSRGGADSHSRAVR